MGTSYLFAISLYKMWNAIILESDEKWTGLEETIIQDMETKTIVSTTDTYMNYEWYILSISWDIKHTLLNNLGEEQLEILINNVSANISIAEKYSNDINIFLIIFFLENKDIYSAIKICSMIDINKLEEYQNKLLWLLFIKYWQYELWCKFLQKCDLLSYFDVEVIEGFMLCEFNWFLDLDFNIVDEDEEDLNWEKKILLDHIKSFIKDIIIDNDEEELKSTYSKWFHIYRLIGHMYLMSNELDLAEENIKRYIELWGKLWCFLMWEIYIKRFYSNVLYAESEELYHPNTTSCKSEPYDINLLEKAKYWYNKWYSLENDYRCCIWLWDIAKLSWLKELAISRYDWAYNNEIPYSGNILLYELINSWKYKYDDEQFINIFQLLKDLVNKWEYIFNTNARGIYLEYIKSYKQWKAKNNLYDILNNLRILTLNFKHPLYQLIYIRQLNELLTNIEKWDYNGKFLSHIWDFLTNCLEWCEDWYYNISPNKLKFIIDMESDLISADIENVELFTENEIKTVFSVLKRFIYFEIENIKSDIIWNRFETELKKSIWSCLIKLWEYELGEEYLDNKLSPDSIHNISDNDKEQEKHLDDKWISREYILNINDFLLFWLNWNSERIVQTNLVPKKYLNILERFFKWEIEPKYIPNKSYLINLIAVCYNMGKNDLIWEIWNYILNNHLLKKFSHEDRLLVWIILLYSWKYEISETITSYSIKSWNYNIIDLYCIIKNKITENKIIQNSMNQERIKETDKAFLKYKRLIWDNPKWYDIFFYRLISTYYILIKNYETALKYINLAIKINDRFWYYQKASILDENWDSSSAENILLQWYKKTWSDKCLAILIRYLRNNWKDMDVLNLLEQAEEKWFEWVMEVMYDIYITKDYLSNGFLRKNAIRFFERYIRSDSFKFNETNELFYLNKICEYYENKNIWNMVDELTISRELWLKYKNPKFQLIYLRRLAVLIQQIDDKTISFEDKLKLNIFFDYLEEINWYKWSEDIISTHVMNINNFIDVINFEISLFADEDWFINENIKPYITVILNIIWFDIDIDMQPSSDNTENNESILDNENKKEPTVMLENLTIH